PVAVIDQFPTNLNDLVTPDEQFWINCTAADESAKRCVRPDYLPWSSLRIGYEAGRKTVTIGTDLRDIAYAKLTFPLSSTAIQPIYRAKWATELLKVPYAKALSNGDITVMVYDPLLSQLYDEFLQRDGSVQLTDDWDVGGDYAITNAKDLTLLNSDGTQKVISQGLVDIYTVEHADWVNKPSCPKGTQPQLIPSVGNVFVGKDYELTGSIKPYRLSETPTAWQIGLEIRVKSLITGEFEKSNSGEITVFTQCK
ncbi:type II secretion system protein, partial [Vibrio jasicida]|uniref:type II secretion system protein n=1 Tax=Vibrio jasicida TaxID=766224 RepID=UPI00391F5D52